MEAAIILSIIGIAVVQAVNPLRVIGLYVEHDRVRVCPPVSLAGPHHAGCVDVLDALDFLDCPITTSLSPEYPFANAA